MKKNLNELKIDREKQHNEVYKKTDLLKLKKEKKAYQNIKFDLFNK